MNRYQSQYDRSNLDLSPSPPKQTATPANIRLNEQQQQIIMNQLRVIQQIQQQHQQQDLRHLNDMPPNSIQQHQQQVLIDQYQAKIQQQSEVNNMLHNSPKHGQSMGFAVQRDQLQHSDQQDKQQPALTNNQLSPAVKSNRPISYSAVVAKSTGINMNNTNPASSITANNPNLNSTVSSFTNNTNDNNVNNIKSTNSKSSSLITMNSAFGGLGHSNLMNMESYNASGNRNSLVGSNSSNKFNNFQDSNNINGHTLRAPHQLQAENSIIKTSLNQHIANQSKTNDIFNSTNLSGSLGHTNGSSLLKQHNSNTMMAPEPLLDNLSIDHPTTPAQLFKQQNHSFRQNQMPINLIQQHQNHSNTSEINAMSLHNSCDKQSPPHGRATNLLGFMGLYVGNLSPDLTKEQLERIFSKYGEPVKAHRLIRSPVAFIKYENTESPRAAIDDLFGVLLPELTLNQDQPLKLHFDRNDAQLKANYRPTDLPREDNGECYSWRTTVCRRGKSCTKKHIPINRGIDFQMWMIRNNPTAVTGTATS